MKFINESDLEAMNAEERKQAEKILRKEICAICEKPLTEIYCEDDQTAVCSSRCLTEMYGAMGGHQTDESDESYRNQNGEYW